MTVDLRVRFLLVFVILSALLAVACSNPRESESQRNANANSAAGKLGQAAHTVAVHAEKAAETAGRKLDKAAKDVQAGWDESARKEKEKAQ